MPWSKTTFYPRWWPYTWPHSGLSCFVKRVTSSFFSNKAVDEVAMGLTPYFHVCLWNKFLGNCVGSTCICVTGDPYKLFVIGYVCSAWIVCINFLQWEIQAEINKRFPCRGKPADLGVCCFSMDTKSINSGSEKYMFISIQLLLYNIMTSQVHPVLAKTGQMHGLFLFLNFM